MAGGPDLTAAPTARSARQWAWRSWSWAGCERAPAHGERRYPGDDRQLVGSLFRLSSTSRPVRCYATWPHWPRVRSCGGCIWVAWSLD